MPIVRPMAKLMRLDSSLLISLSVFVPLLARTRSIGLSLGRATPLIFAGACTFIANDLDDVERDRINHPERPLPSGHIKPPVAVALYFVCLMSALFTTRFFVRTNAAFWYYAFLTLSISYGYVVDFFAGFKSIYVAVAISAPAFIVAIYDFPERRLLFASGSIFLFVLGRELCMDLVDRAGDTASFMHRLNSRSVAIAAFILQLSGLLLVAIQCSGRLDAIAALVVTVVLAWSGYLWFRLASHRQAITLMKVQLFVGLYFLL